jgi:hypothetical protein
LIAALSDNWHLGIWQVNPTRLLHVIETPVGDYADSAGGAFDSTGRQFAFSAGEEARLYDVPTGRELWKGQTKRSSHDLGVCLDASGKLLAYTEWEPPDERRRLVRLSDFQQVGVIAGCDTLAPLGRELADRNSWFLGTPRRRYSIPLLPLDGSPSNALFSPDGRLLAWSAGDGTV